MIVNSLLSILLTLTLNLTPSGRVEMEVPDSVCGRKVCMATKVLSLSDPGEAVAGQISETCISLTFQRVGSFVELRQQGGIARRFPVLRAVAGGAVVDLTDFFLTEYAGLVTYPITAYNSMGGTVMRTHNPVREKCRVEKVVKDTSSVGVLCDMSYTMDGHLYGMFKIDGDFSLRAKVVRFFFEPQAEVLPRKDEDTRFGVRTVEYSTEPQAQSAIEIRKAVVRRSLDAPLVYAVDTLMPPSWKKGVRGAVESWNDGFQKCGLGRPLLCRDMRPDEDLLCNNVIYVPSGMDSFECTLLRDPQDGTIYSSSIVLHSSYISKLCHQYMVQAAVADKRARTSTLPDDVVGEIVHTACLQAIGRSLGLLDNPGASATCSVADLLDPSHCSKYGVTQSVMEAPVFNYLADSTDFERGVSVAQLCLSPYDLGAIDFLYGEGKSGDCGIPYVGSKDEINRFVPYAVRGDLSSDPVGAMVLLSRNQACLIANAEKWFEDEKVRRIVKEESRGSFARLLVRMTDYLTADWPQGPSHVEVMDAVLAQLRDLSWMDDAASEEMYKRNVFRQMCQVACRPSLLKDIYKKLGKNESEWKDMVVTQLGSLAANDAEALAALSWIGKKETDEYLKNRIDILLWQ